MNKGTTTTIAMAFGFGAMGGLLNSAFMTWLCSPPAVTAAVTGAAMALEAGAPEGGLVIASQAWTPGRGELCGDIALVYQASAPGRDDGQRLTYEGGTCEPCAVGCAQLGGKAFPVDGGTGDQKAALDRIANCIERCRLGAP